MTTNRNRARTVRLYADILGIPAPAEREGESGTRTIAVSRADLPLLRWRLLAAGAPVREETPDSLSFRDPDGVHVTLVTGSPD